MPLPPRPSASFDRVFVYGTLRSGQTNAHWLDRATRLGAAESPACFRRFDIGAYPAALAGGETALVGEGYRIDAAVLDGLDVLERVPIDYTRETIDTAFGPAWIDVWAGAQAPHWQPLVDGDWVAHRRRLSFVTQGF